MEISINGKKVYLESGLTLAKYLAQEGFNPDHIIVEYNHEIIRKDCWDGIVLNQDDNLEILSFVGGG